MECVYCKARLRPGDKITLIHVFDHMRNGVPYAVQDPEAAHYDCVRPGHTLAQPEVPSQRLPRYNPGMVPRACPSHQCLYCGEVFKRFDRIVEVFRVSGSDIDPERGSRGIVAEKDVEYAHGRCNDRDATHGRGPGPGLVIL